MCAKFHSHKYASRLFIVVIYCKKYNLWIYFSIWKAYISNLQISINLFKTSISITTTLLSFPRMWPTEWDFSPSLYFYEQHNGCHMWNRICLPFQSKGNLSRFLCELCYTQSFRNTDDFLPNAFGKPFRNFGSSMLFKRTKFRHPEI